MAKKSSKKKPAAKKPVKKAAKKAPAKISSGSGASVGELGAKLVELFNQNKADAWIQTVWSKDIRSIEGSGDVATGKGEIMKKWEWWNGTFDVLGASAEGPYCGATGFAVKFSIHTKNKQTGEETRMSEIAVYSVKNGKVVQEEFMYGGC